MLFQVLHLNFASLLKKTSIGTRTTLTIVNEKLGTSEQIAKTEICSSEWTITLGDLQISLSSFDRVNLCLFFQKM